MSTGRAAWRRLGFVPARRLGSLLSFEGPRAEDLGSTASVKLENCTKAKRVICTDRAYGRGGAHRQDAKGTRWMPWHQEPMKDVDGCDKPRGAAERALIRGFPNGETHPW